MTIEELINYGNKYLEIDKVKLILSTILGINSLELSLYLSKIIDLELVNKYQDIIKKVKNGKPIQYALNNVCFYGYDYYVDEKVLIPRFETEELVFHSINYMRKFFANPNVLDLCAGSGCIGLTLKKELPNISMSLSDISQEALDVLKINKDRLLVDCKIILSDLFENIYDKFDVIISNPPYIAYTDEVDEIVLKNEPHLALFAENSGLKIYERILKDCEKYLNKKYMIAFEIGKNQKDAVINLVNKYLKNVKIIAKKDASNRERFIFVFKNLNMNE